MKHLLEHQISLFLQKYQAQQAISTSWGTPLVGFADVEHPYVKNLKNTISENHASPTDVLPDATIVVAYYIPFTRELAKLNRESDRLAAPQWALAYEETNEMFLKLNDHLINCLKEYSYVGVTPKEALSFNRDTLTSNWSHRHFAYAAGLGTFGINNMLITEKGCCGRFFTLVTNLNVTPDEPMTEELCYYKKDGSCDACIKNCPQNAITVDGYDGKKCFELLQENASTYKSLNSSYDGSMGNEVCGKCITSSPCMFF